MAAASKSSQKAKNAVIALLLLWSIISLIVIVVWATSPDLKSSAQCRAELREVTEKLEGSKVLYHKDKVALEEQVEAEREETNRQRAEILLLLGRLNTTNITLEECHQENVSDGVHLCEIAPTLTCPESAVSIYYLQRETKSDRKCASCNKANLKK